MKNTPENAERLTAHIERVLSISEHRNPGKEHVVIALLSEFSAKEINTVISTFKDEWYIVNKVFKLVPYKCVEVHMKRKHKNNS